MLTYKSVQQIVEKSLEAGKRISEIVLLDQSLQLGCSQEDLYKHMLSNFKVMLDSIRGGLNSDLKSASGLSKKGALKLKKLFDSGKNIGGRVFTQSLIKALAVSEFNTCMGRIVAAPTAGSSGIIPAVVITVMEEKSVPEDDVVMGLFTSGAIGKVIANRAFVSGAEGGCQAECGSASAMAASVLVELLGGTPCQVSNACAIALKNTLGLVCDPVAGLVEVPCVKRNAMGAANALVAAELALAGIESVIPADEVIDAMKSIGDSMCHDLKETAEGGLAATPTGKRIAEQLYEE